MTTQERALRIGELAGQLGLNPKTIRYYEAIGLLPAPRRTAAGYRLYQTEDRERLAFIRKAQAVGLTLDEIGHLLELRQAGERPCGYLAGVVERKLADVDAQLHALEEFRGELLALRAEANGGRASGGQVCSVIEQHALPSGDPLPRAARRAARQAPVPMPEPAG